MAFQSFRSGPMAMLDDSAALEALQRRMHLAVVATPVDLIGVGPSAKEIFRLVHDLCGLSCLPSYISNYEPDYVLHFDSIQARDAVINLGLLQTSTATLSLSLWTPHYRNHTIPWETKVLITVSHIPPNSCHPDILPPLLSAYCDIRSSTFNKIKGTCQIVAFTTTPSAIPISGTIAYRERSRTCTILRTYGVSLTCRAAQIPSDEIFDSPLFKAFCEEYPQYHYTMLHTAFEFGVDPDVLYEFYVQTALDEDIANGLLNHDEDTTSSDCSMDYDGYSCRMMDDYSPSDDLSDREPADWRGSNI